MNVIVDQDQLQAELLHNGDLSALLPVAAKGSRRAKSKDRRAILSSSSERPNQTMESTRYTIQASRRAQQDSSTLPSTHRDALPPGRNDPPKYKIFDAGDRLTVWNDEEQHLHRLDGQSVNMNIRSSILDNLALTVHRTLSLTCTVPAQPDPDPALLALVNSRNRRRQSREERKNVKANESPPLPRSISTSRELQSPLRDQEVPSSRRSEHGDDDTTPKFVPATDIIKVMEVSDQVDVSTVSRTMIDVCDSPQQNCVPIPAKDEKNKGEFIRIKDSFQRLLCSPEAVVIAEEQSPSQEDDQSTSMVATGFSTTAVGKREEVVESGTMLPENTVVPTRTAKSPSGSLSINSSGNMSTQARVQTTVIAITQTKTTTTTTTSTDLTSPAITKKPVPTVSVEALSEGDRLDRMALQMSQELNVKSWENTTGEELLTNTLCETTNTSSTSCRPHPRFSMMLNAWPSAAAPQVLKDDEESVESTTASVLEGADQQLLLNHEYYEESSISSTDSPSINDTPLLEMICEEEEEEEEEEDAVSSESPNNRIEEWNQDNRQESRLTTQTLPTQKESTAPRPKPQLTIITTWPSCEAKFPAEEVDVESKTRSCGEAGAPQLLRGNEEFHEESSTSSLDSGPIDNNGVFEMVFEEEDSISSSNLDESQQHGEGKDDAAAFMSPPPQSKLSLRSSSWKPLLIQRRQVSLKSSRNLLLINEARSTLSNVESKPRQRQNKRAPRRRGFLSFAPA